MTTTSTDRPVKLTTQDRDTRVVVIHGRRFEVKTCRNTRGNIQGYGIFERWPAPRPDAGGSPVHGEWHIEPAQASLRACRDWLAALACGDGPDQPVPTVQVSPELLTAGDRVHPDDPAFDATADLRVHGPAERIRDDHGADIGWWKVPLQPAGVVWLLVPVGSKVRTDRRTPTLAATVDARMLRRQKGTRRYGR